MCHVLFRQRTQLTTADKQAICLPKKQQPTISNTNLVLEFGCGVQNILAESDKWLSEEPDDFHFRNRPVKWPLLEEALWLWVSGVLSREIDINGYCILEKARYFAKRLGNQALYNSSIPTYQEVMKQNNQRLDGLKLEKTNLHICM